MTAWGGRASSSLVPGPPQQGWVSGQGLPVKPVPCTGGVDLAFEGESLANGSIAHATGSKGSDSSNGVAKHHDKVAGLG